jgi:signal transduction histidine kinase
LSVVLFAIVLASATSAYLGGVRVRNEQEESLRRMASTLSEATFPLTQRVLAQMSGLSGAEFVLLDQEDRLEERTLAVTADEAELLAGLAGGPALEARRPKPAVLIGGREYLVDRIPVPGRLPSVSSGTLFVLYPEDRWSASVYRAMYPAMATGVIAAVLVVVMTTVLARRFVRPIHHLVAQTAAVAQGNFAPLAASRRNDELGDLAQSINRMAARLAEYESDVRRSERLRTLGQLGAGLAHQLRNAAAGGRMAIELHRQDCPAGSGDESLEVALRQLRLMESYLQRFLSLSKPGPAACEAIDLAALVDDVLGLLRPTYTHMGVDVDFARPAEPLCLRGDPESVRQLLTNLIANAVEAAKLGGEAPPRVVISACRSGEGRGTISIRDTGAGPAQSVADRLGEAFITSKPDGVGLGLFVARQIAESHRGGLRWERRDGWTWFCFEFPLDTGGGHGTPADC